MMAFESLPVIRSWPLYEKARHLDFGCLLSCAVTDVVEPTHVGALSVQHAGCWECDLTDQSLSWSGGVYDIFGLPRGVPVTRNDALGFYCESSRAAMDRLRDHAIKTKRGFTIDAEIRPAVGGKRWMRLVGVPVCENNRVSRLHGIKLIV
jgi:hypothetical protein